MAQSYNIKDFIQWALFGFLTVLAVTFFYSGSIWKNSQRLETHPIIGRVNPFNLTNHLGEVITEKKFKGKPWLANVIFTRCPTVCPRITQSIAKIAPQLPSQISILSITTDPEFDTVAKLNDFKNSYGTDMENWHFVTGQKDNLINLIVRDLKMTSVPKNTAERENPADLFVHSSLLVLVDSGGRIRKSFESDTETLADDINAALIQLKESDQ